MRAASLEITITSPACARYRLLDAAGRMLWQNRVYNAAQGHAGARARLTAWAATHGYKVVEQKEPSKHRA